MNDSRGSMFFWAIGLAVTGLLLLLFNFGLLVRFEPLAQYVVAGFFAAVAVGFFAGYLSNRTMWWRLIPGWTLLSVAGMVLLSTLPAVNPLLIPALLFVGLALAFGNIYLVNRRDNWWAIIPGGFMLVLSVVISLNTVVDSLEILGAVLLAGMGLVFFLLSVLGPERAQWWPLIPGLVLVLFGLFILTSSNESESVLLRWWPVILIVIGLGMGWRAMRHTPRQDKLSVNVAPGTSNARQDVVESSATPAREEPGVLGEYSEPAPGASVEVISDYDDEQS
jgi:MFS family permease